MKKNAYTSSLSSTNGIRKYDMDCMSRQFSQSSLLSPTRKVSSSTNGDVVEDDMGRSFTQKYEIKSSDISKALKQNERLYKGKSNITNPKPKILECGCEKDSNQHSKMTQLLKLPSCDIKELCQLSWNGIPWCVRGKVWRILTGYIPTKTDEQPRILIRKRQEYQNYINQYFYLRNNSGNGECYRQITIDIPRTHPNMSFLHNPKIIQLYERILYIWAIRHPACGYVQGINDLIAPFLISYLYEYLGKDYETHNISTLSDSILNDIEADIFWTFSHLMDDIQDNYTPDQPGIQKRVRLLEKIISFADKKLSKFLTDLDVNFLQFSLRWMNNLLVREIPIECTIRLWDTYFAESNGFDQLHLFVCTAFLMKFSSVIVRLQDFQEVSYFIQNLPTHNWKDEDISVLLAEAFQLQFLYSNILERN